MPNASTSATRSESLHDLAEQMLAILDSTDGEITPEVEAQLAMLMPRIEAKVEGYAAVCARLDAEGEALKGLASRYADRAKLKANASDRLKARLRETMEALGEKRIATGTVTATIVANSQPSLELDDDLDVDTLPKEYVVVTRKPDAAAIKAALQVNLNLPWARLVRGTHLRFR